MNNVASKYKLAQLAQVRIGEDRDTDILLNLWYRTSGQRSFTDTNTDEIYYSDSPVQVEIVDYDYTVVKKDSNEEVSDYYFPAVQSSVFDFLGAVSENDLDFLERAIDGGFRL